MSIYISQLDIKQNIYKMYELENCRIKRIIPKYKMLGVGMVRSSPHIFLLYNVLNLGDCLWLIVAPESQSLNGHITLICGGDHFSVAHPERTQALGIRINFISTDKDCTWRITYVDL